MIRLDNLRNWNEPNHPTFNISKQCRIAQVSRSSFYYQKEADNGKDNDAIKVMDRLYLKDGTLGTRRYVEELKGPGFLLERDKVRSLMRTMGICAVYRKRRTTVIDPTKYKFPYLLRGYQTSRPNEVWSIDISYIPMKQGFMYLFTIIDVHSRYLVSLEYLQKYGSQLDGKNHQIGN
jgi:putative transposase